MYKYIGLPSFLVFQFFALWLPSRMFESRFIQDVKDMTGGYYLQSASNPEGVLIILALYAVIVTSVVKRYGSRIGTYLGLLVTSGLALAFSMYLAVEGHSFEFGNTWRATEIFWSLVYRRAYFIPLFLLGIVLSTLLYLVHYKLTNRESGNARLERSSGSRKPKISSGITKISSNTKDDLNG